MLRRLIDYRNPDSFASHLRRKRSQFIRQMIESVYAECGKCDILDLGGTRLYWKIIPDDYFRRHKVTIVLLNVADTPIHDASDIFSVLTGNACDLSIFSDCRFDIVHSNSVIEHVGPWQNMSQMAKEIRRVGRSYYLQTPYFWFPIEPHYMTPFIHWLPMSWRVRIAMRFSLGNWPRAKDIDEAIRAQSSAVLLDKAMLQHLFPDATIQFERVLGLPKSLIAMCQCHSRLS